MMKESFVSSLNTSKSMTQNFKQTQKNQNDNHNAKCIKSRQAVSLCITKYCNKNAFICNQNSCPCFAVHQNCFKIPIKEFTKKFQKKIVNVDEQINFHDKKVDQFIDNIIDEASKVKETFKVYAQQKFKYILLSQNGRNMLKSLKQNNAQQINGEYCYQLFNQMNELLIKSYKDQIAKQLQKIQKQWKIVQNVCKKQLQSMVLKLKKQFLKPEQKNFFNQSKIVKDWKQKENIFNFFNKKIKQVQLIYRASQNAFKVDNFYKLTKGIKNTLILVQTQFNKKIGGFTPLQWKQVQQSQLIPDNSNSTFIFSLSNNQKFQQKDLNSGIQYYQNYGPRFSKESGNADLAIYNEANNQIGSTYCQLNKGYIHKNKVNKIIREISNSQETPTTKCISKQNNGKSGQQYSNENQSLKIPQIKLKNNHKHFFIIVLNSFFYFYSFCYFYSNSYFQNQQL